MPWAKSKRSTYVGQILQVKDRKDMIRSRKKYIRKAELKIASFKLGQVIGERPRTYYSMPICTAQILQQNALAPTYNLSLF